MKQSELAEKIAREAHAGQFRRDGVTPYITHPERVAARVKEIASRFTDPDEAVAVAWLHDVLEDCPSYTMETLTELGVSKFVAQRVFDLSRQKQERYEAYLAAVKDSYMTRMVKTADILDNLTDSPTPKQKEKYLKALLYLVE